MTGNTSQTQTQTQTQTQAQTARLVRDLGSGQQSSAISNVLADVSTATCLELRAQNRSAARREGSA